MYVVTKMDANYDHAEVMGVFTELGALKNELFAQGISFEDLRLFEDEDDEGNPAIVAGAYHGKGWILHFEDLMPNFLNDIS